MGVATEITRIQNAKADIKTAIENRGVTVGDGLIDTYADKIAKISIGGGDYRTMLWDGLQDNGARTNYSQQFRGWKNLHEYWYPIYDMNMSDASLVFYSATSELGLPELCKKAGIKIDWSNASTFAQTFSYANIPDVGIINTTGAKSLSSMFLNSYVKKAHLILKADGSQHSNQGAFTGANKLTDLTIEGAFGSSDVIIPSKVLTPESMISVIESLVDYSGEEEQYLYTVSFDDECWGRLEEHSTAPNGGTWKAYTVSKGWNV